MPSERPSLQTAFFPHAVATVTKIPSFPRRRESRTRDGGNIQRLSENSEVLDSRFRGNDGGEVSVFPINYRNLKSRHSRAGGNLGRSVRLCRHFGKLMNRHSRAGENLGRSVRLCRHFGKLMNRHPRAGGNPGRSVSVMSAFRETDESSSPRRRESRNAGRRQYSKVV